MSFLYHILRFSWYLIFFCLDPDLYPFCLDPDPYQSSVWCRIRNEFFQIRIRIKTIHIRNTDYNLYFQAAGVARGAMKPGHEVTGYLTRKHIYEIAKIKSQVGKMVPSYYRLFP